MQPAEPFEVAIVGGGLCGLSLAIALSKRSIPFKIYESRGSFTELGAGINIGPNTLEAFKLIDESLGDAIKGLCTQNPPGKEDVWMQLRFGAPTRTHADAELITEIMAPPTGNTTVLRNDLLQLLAETAGLEHAVFNKKLTGLHQNDASVTLKFEDGTEETASAVIATDGIHSAVRRALLGPDNPACEPLYSGVGAYRAIVPTETLAEAIGSDRARTSQVILGPGAYVIMYPIDHGKKVNVGLWPYRKGPWTSRDWVLPGQRKEMEAQFSAWGQSVHKIMDLMGDPPFFATFTHARQPESFHSGMVCLIGDAAHSMPPHQGAGSGQAMEDAYVISEVLRDIDLHKSTSVQVEAAFTAFEAVRMPRAQEVLESSVEAFDFWAEFYSESLTDDNLQHFIENAHGRFHSIWNADLAGQGRQARILMKQTLEKGT